MIIYIYIHHIYLHMFHWYYMIYIYIYILHIIQYILILLFNSCIVFCIIYIYCSIDMFFNKCISYIKISWTFCIPKYLGLFALWPSFGKPSQNLPNKAERAGQKWCKVAKSCPQCLWIVFPWECPQNQGSKCPHPSEVTWKQCLDCVVTTSWGEIPPIFSWKRDPLLSAVAPNFLEFSANLLEFFSLHSNRRVYITRWYIQDRNIHANKAQNPANTAEPPQKKRKCRFLPWRTLKVVAKPQNSMRNCHRIWCVLKMNSSEDSEVCHYSWYSWRLADKDHNRSSQDSEDRSCHPFFRLNTHDAEISAFVHATAEEVTVTWE